MNSTPQLDIHPDVESLNAFVEQALPDQERGQILAHLAACGRCRQVVYFAQEASAGLETATETASDSAMQPAAERHIGTRLRAWFRSWKLAWVPAVALTGIIGVAVLVHMRRGELDSQLGAGNRAGSGSELAKAVPQAASQSGVTSAEGLPVQPRSPEISSAEMSSAAVGTVKPMEKKARPAAVRESSNAPSAEVVAAAPPMTQASESVMVQADEKRAASMPESPAQRNGGPISVAQFKPEQTAIYPQPPGASGAPASRNMGTNSTKTKMAGVADRVQSSPTPSLMSSAQQLELQKGASGDSALATQQSVTAAEFALKASPTKLPSGLLVLSTATAQHRTLAIDLAGVLFLSEDARAHWEQVERQWTGRAVVVRVRQPSTINSAVAAGLAQRAVENPSTEISGGAGVESPARSAGFEIVNDNGQVWTSTDGKTWKPK